MIKRRRIANISSSVCPGDSIGLPANTVEQVCSNTASRSCQAKPSSSTARCREPHRRDVSDADCLTPPLDVHALHQQPQAERQLADERREQNRRKDQVLDTGREEERSAVRQIANACDLNQAT